MSRPQSAKTARALRMIGKPDGKGGTYTAYRAALLQGIALSTIYRATKRQKAKDEK